MICIMDCTFVSPAFQTSRFRARLWTQIVEIGLLWEHAAEHAFEESLFFVWSAPDAAGGGRTCNLCKLQTGTGMAGSEGTKLMPASENYHAGT